MRAGTHLKTVGLFAGIGGLELGLTKAGHEIAFLCEIDPALSFRRLFIFVYLAKSLYI